MEVHMNKPEFINITIKEFRDSPKLKCSSEYQPKVKWIILNNKPYSKKYRTQNKWTDLKNDPYFYGNVGSDRWWLGEKTSMFIAPEDYLEYHYKLFKLI